MNISRNEVTKNLHAKLDESLCALKATKNHLESYQKATEAAVNVQLKMAKTALKEKKQKIDASKARFEELIEAKKEESVAAVAEWKAKRNQQKLEKRVERAEQYADACVTLAMYYSAEAELAILEAITARQDAKASQSK